MTQATIGKGDEPAPAKRTDTEIAADLKRRIIIAHQELLVVYNDAKAAGFEVAVQVNDGPLGYAITGLRLLKVY